MRRGPLRDKHEASPASALNRRPSGAAVTKPAARRAAGAGVAGSGGGGEEAPDAAHAHGAGWGMPEEASTTLWKGGVAMSPPLSSANIPSSLSPSCAQGGGVEWSLARQMTALTLAKGEAGQNGEPAVGARAQGSEELTTPQADVHDSGWAGDDFGCAAKCACAPACTCAARHVKERALQARVRAPSRPALACKLAAPSSEACTCSSAQARAAWLTPARLAPASVGQRPSLVGSRASCALVCLLHLSSLPVVHAGIGAGARGRARRRAARTPGMHSHTHAHIHTRTQLPPHPLAR